MSHIGTFPPEKKSLVTSVNATLADLRDNPSSLGITAINALLKQCLELLESLKWNGAPGHWYCPKAPSDAQEMSTFLIRFHAYKDKGAPEWREHLWMILKECPDCVTGYLEARERSDSTYAWIHCDDTVLAGDLTSSASFADIFRNTMNQKSRQ